MSHVDGIDREVKAKNDHDDTARIVRESILGERTRTTMTGEARVIKARLLRVITRLADLLVPKVTD